jgi:hypothetical protein
MNVLDSKRLVTTALVLLALLNVALLATLWWQGTNRALPGSEAKNHHKGQPSFIRELGLSESQSLSFDRLRKEHFQKVGAEMQAIALLKKQLVEESLQERPDTIKIAGIAGNIGLHQAAIERQLALHFHELAGVCTPEQRSSLKIILERIATRKHSDRSERWGNNPPPAR